MIKDFESNKELNFKIKSNLNVLNEMIETFRTLLSEIKISTTTGTNEDGKYLEINAILPSEIINVLIDQLEKLKADTDEYE